MYKPQEKYRVLELSQNGWSANKIAAETGMSRATVYRILQEVETSEEEEHDNFETDEYGSSLVEDDDDHYPTDDSEGSETYEIDEDENEIASHIGSETVSNKSQSSPETVNHDFETPLPASVPSPVNPEVEKLRLQLAHEREMEKLRQQARRQELEGERLAQESRKLALQETHLKRESKVHQEQLLQQAKLAQQTNQALLRRIQRTLTELLKVTEEEKLNQEEISQWIEQWEALSEGIMLRAEELEEDEQNWLVNQATDMILEALVEASEQIENSFWDTTATIEWDEKQLQLLQVTQQAYALNQPA